MTDNWMRKILLIYRPMMLACSGQVWRESCRSSLTRGSSEQKVGKRSLACTALGLGLSKLAGVGSRRIIWYEGTVVSHFVIITDLSPSSDIGMKATFVIDEGARAVFPI